MKTPREILLQRHAAATPKLDAIRHAMVEELNNKDTKIQSWAVALVALFLGCSQKLWRELVWPCRQVWAGLAAVWVVILAVNFSASDTELVAGKSPPPFPEMTMTFPQQEKLLAELMGPNEPRVAVPLKSFSPRPSSERRFETLTA